MHERPKNKERLRRTLEDTADTLLVAGDFAGAQATLSEFSKRYSEPDSFFYANLKLFALPLYELAHHPSTEERVRAANDTYGQVASLIDLELTTRNNYPNESEENYRRIGRLSALTVFELLIRDGVQDTVAAVPIPASRQDDMHRGIDFYLSPIGTGKINDGWAMQVKTSPTKADREKYDETNIVLIGMNEIDEHATDPNNANSLARCVLRELDGTLSEQDHTKLTRATAQLYEKITHSKKVDDSIKRRNRLGKITRTLLLPVIKE